jgi:hypothetical protein
VRGDLLVVEHDFAAPAREEIDDPGPGVHGHLYYRSCEHSFAVCGTGPSGVPSCTADIKQSMKEACEGDVVRRSAGDYRMRMRLTGQSLGLRRLGGSPDPGLTGTHALAFP